MEFTINYDVNDPVRSLGALASAYGSALRLAVDQLAELQGTDDLSWLDDLRSQAIFHAKGLDTEDIPVESEARIMRFSIENLEAFFDAARAGIIEKG
ncbi:hypothetical protein [Martelella sp. FOR1707]